MGIAATAASVSVAAAVFIALLILAAVTVAMTSAEWIRPARMVGGGVRRWSGYVLAAVGIWFLVLAALPSPVLV